ncbi:MAG: hypothetical protein ACFCAD_11100, partial [Pleurocapsa sp.]
KLPTEHNSIFELKQKPLDATRVYAWKLKLSEQDRSDKERIRGDILQELGYELSKVKIAPWRKLIRGLNNSLKTWLYQLKDKYLT